MIMTDATLRELLNNT
nr:unnamed protein product [Callosobruchus chinensis]